MQSKSKLASKYTIEYCRELLAQNPQGCDRLYFQTRKDVIMAESKRVENRDAVRMALIDGPKTIGEIVKWAREQNIADLDMPLCNIILPALKRDGEVEWDGRNWRAEKLKPLTRVITGPEPDLEEPPEPKEPPAPEERREMPKTRDWTHDLSTLSALGNGGNVVIDVPEDWDQNHFANNLRSVLNGRKETRDSKWSLQRVGERGMKVTRLAVEAVESVPLAPPEKPTPKIASRVGSHADAVIADLDRQIEELTKLKMSLVRFYSREEQCQSSLEKRE